MQDRTTLQPVCEKLIRYLESGDAPAGLFTDDVFCDFTPPQWRIQARGLDAVLAIRRRGHPAPGRVPRWSVEPTPSGFLMELEERWTDSEGDWYCREAIIARLRGESIEHLAVYCTGDWDWARQQAHAAQVTLLQP
jgi:hypothetical protein